MKTLCEQEQRKVNGGAYTSYTMWVAKYMGYSFQWQNPTGTFYYQGYFPETNWSYPHKYYSTNVWVP